MDTLITVPPAFAAFLHRSPRIRAAWARRWADPIHRKPVLLSDPADVRLGSGGGTVHALWSAWRQSGTRSTLRDWLRSSPKLVLHSGGESRRLPAYAAIGKAFTPFPGDTGDNLSIRGDVLADTQLRLYQQVLAEAGPNVCVLIASGDVTLDFDGIGLPSTTHDVVGIGAPAHASVAQHFGVFFTPRSKKAIPGHELTITEFRQKPSQQTIERLARTCFAWVDTGLWILSLAAVEALFRRCGWIDRIENFDTPSKLPRPVDLYTEIGAIFGQGRRLSRELASAGFGQLSSAVIVPAHARFGHIGSSRQLLDAMEKHASSVAGAARADRSRHARAAAPRIWREGCSASALRCAGENLVTGLPSGARISKLGHNWCVDVSPVGRNQYVLRPYHRDDTLRGPAHDAVICGQRSSDWLQARGFPVEGADIFRVAIYPVLSASEITQEALEWFFSHKPSSKITKAFQRRARLSASDIPNAVNFSRYFAQRGEMATARIKKEFAALLDGNSTALLNRDFATLVDFVQVDDAGLCPWLLSRRKKLLALRLPELDELKLRLFFARLQTTSTALGERDGAFEPLARAVLNATGPKSVQPRSAIGTDEIVCSRSPVRLDLAGGWTDTPPYCFANGGRVLNVAVTLQGHAPIQVVVRRIPEFEFRLSSIDLGAHESVRSYAELMATRLPHSPFALHRAALAVAGFVPEFQPHQARQNLAAQLRKFGHGLEITSLSAIPKGSGLGTSSILAATLIAALNRTCGLGWNTYDLYQRVLMIEQLLTTGGGWQDQAGALFPGLKFIQTQPGLEQSPHVRQLDSSLLDSAIATGELLLYYTGITRLAKGILQQIVEAMALGDGSTLSTLRLIGQNAADALRACENSDATQLKRSLRRSWRLNCQLDAGTTTPEIQQILSTAGNDLAAAKLLGAGGGGFMLIWATDPRAASRIRRQLEKSPPNPRARFVDFALSQRPVEVAVT